MPSICTPRHLPLAATAACVLALTACGVSDTAGATASPPTSTQASSAAPSSHTVEKPGSVATTVIKLFARPDEPERRWFTDLLPYLDDGYAEDAAYIDPARIPFDRVISGPTLSGDADNPRLVTAEFKTSDGIWGVELHQDVPGGEWLVGGIAPAHE